MVSPFFADSSALEKLIGIAFDAGNAILALPKSDINATSKADGSPVTRADLAANEIIVQGLADSFPNVPVMTEERAPDTRALGARHVFLVDPLDGTRDFLSGNGE